MLDAERQVVPVKVHTFPFSQSPCIPTTDVQPTLTVRLVFWYNFPVQNITSPKHKSPIRVANEIDVKIVLSVQSNMKSDDSPEDARTLNLTPRTTTSPETPR